MALPSAAPPIDGADAPVGRRSAVVHDPARAGRTLDLEIWYLAASDDGPLTTYEVLPGITFESARARHDAPVAPGRYPLLLLSHGRTGTRLNYTGLCESLAGRGAIVVAPDHPGDVLMDWLSGRHADDRTNEVDRLADAHLLLAALTGSGPRLGLAADLVEAVDPERIAVIGHSYGGQTALACAAGSRGVPQHPLVRAVVGLQAYTRTTSDGFLSRVTTPALLVVSELDRTTPPASDADRPWALLRGRPTWRLDLAGTGHHASSDVPLYAELVHQVPGVPDLVRQYLALTAAESAGPGAPPWRTTSRRIVDVVWLFLAEVLDLHAAPGALDTLERLGAEGVTLRRR